MGQKARLAYRTWGAADAPPVLLLHALGEDCSDWSAVAAALAGSFHVIAADLRGHGASEWPGTYSPELMRDDVDTFLDGLGLDQVAVAGHSLGGCVAYLLAAAVPWRVTRLVLEEPAPPWPRPPRTLPRPDEPLGFDWAVTAMTSTWDPPPSWRDELAAITAPTLIVAGGPDSAVDQGQLAGMAELIPDCRLVTIRAGHLVHAARPAEFTAAITPFLAR